MAVIRRWWLPIALLLSLGINLGVVAMLVLQRDRDPLPDEVPVEVPVSAAPEPAFDRPLDPETATPAEQSTPSADKPVAPRQDRPNVPPRRDLQPRSAPEREPKPESMAAPEPEEDPAPPRPGPGAERALGRQDPPIRRFETLARNLGLDEVEARRFAALQRRHFEGSRETRRRLEAARRELAQEFLGGQAERPRVDRLRAEVERLQAELDQTLVALLLESQEILTPEQQRRFAFFVLQRLRNAGPGRESEARGPLRRPLQRRRAAPP